MKFPSRWCFVLGQRRNIVAAAALGAMVVLAPTSGAMTTLTSSCGCCCAHQSGSVSQSVTRTPRRRRSGRPQQVRTEQ